MTKIDNVLLIYQTFTETKFTNEPVVDQNIKAEEIKKRTSEIRRLNAEFNNLERRYGLKYDNSSIKNIFSLFYKYCKENSFTKFNI
jgi:hypothetical protein